MKTLIRTALVLSLLPAMAMGQGATASRLAPIPNPEVTRIAPKVRSIRVEPSTVTLQVGQTIGLDKLTVIVIDSLGNVRGRLTGYDFSIAPGEAASAVPFTITANRPGSATLVIHYPRNSWTMRKDPRPEARVSVVVKP